MNSRLFSAAGFAASFLALFCLLGGHWFALQSVAWARMIAEFSKAESFNVALAKTFDGEHPCKMCLGIREGRQQEEQESREVPLVKDKKSPDLFAEVRQTEAPAPPCAAADATGFVPQLRSDFVDRPPSPPPRFFKAVL